mmetsp:Transcript_25497/g.42996  ORF Transcript_25497/g.42996 Transcript_25497/m.42996 type:complete len:346 (-) Transcript_25497:325-1362(-)
MAVTMSMIMVLGSSMSIAACFLLCLYLFRSTKMKRVSYQIIFLISLCDMFAAIGTVFGLTDDGSPECWVQSIFTQIFPLASALWTLLIGVHVIFTIRSIPVKDEVFVGWRMCLFCFGLPVVVTMLPFSTSTYGCIEDEPCWCFVRDTKSSPDWAMTVWYIVSFYLWIWLCLLLNMSLLVYSLVSVQSISQDAYKEKIRDVLIKLLGYPVVVIVSWTCTTIYDMILVLNPDYYLLVNDAYYNLSFVLPCFQGFLATCVFLLTHINCRSFCSRAGADVYPVSRKVSGDDNDGSGDVEANSRRDLQSSFKEMSVIDPCKMESEQVQLRAQYSNIAEEKEMTVVASISQ